MTSLVRGWRAVAVMVMALWTVALAACSGGAALPPPAPEDAASRQREQQAFVEAMRPPPRDLAVDPGGATAEHAAARPGRPVIAVLAANEGTEMTDLMLPYALLRRADVAEVEVVAPTRGPIRLYPALQVEATQDFAGFARAHPRGADYVIVPAMARDDDPVLVDWLREQARNGARVIGVCVGVRMLGRAGLLDGRRYTGHWYDRETLQRRHPTGTHVPHRRYLADRGVATTTGITASVPAMLALVEAIGGRARAKALAAELGTDTWTPAHDTSRFELTAARRWHYVLEKIAFWRDESWRAEVQDGSDDVALALVADAWSRTGRVEVVASAAGPVRLASGLVLDARPAPPGLPALPLQPGQAPLHQLDRTLCEIGARFGSERRDWVMQEMEYAGHAAASPAECAASTAPPSLTHPMSTSAPTPTPTPTPRFASAADAAAATAFKAAPKPLRRSP